MSPSLSSTTTTEKNSNRIGSVSAVVSVAVVAIVAAVVASMVSSSMTPSSSVYYSPDSSNYFIPVAILYSLASHVWLFGIQRHHSIVNEIVTPLSSNKNTAAAAATTTTTIEQQQKKKVIVITGANTGIGYEAAKSLVLRGHEVILACRTKDKALQAQRSIQQELVVTVTQSQQQSSKTTTKKKNDDDGGGKVVVLDPILDLSDFDSIRSYVQTLQEKYDKIDVLINNAGRNTSGPSSTSTKLTSTSIETQIDLDLMFQSNYLGHFLLTELMLEGITRTGETGGEGGGSSGTDKVDGGSRPLLRDGSKVINVSSVMHHFAGGFLQKQEQPNENKKKEANDDGVRNSNNDIDMTATSEYWLSHATATDPPSPGVYSASKLAAVLHAVEIRNRYFVAGTSEGRESGVDAVVVNPGTVASDIWRGYPSWIRSIFRRVYLSPQQGSVPLVAAAVGSVGDAAEEEDVQTSSSSSSSNRSIQYFQPYWIPPAYKNKAAPPFIEMFGPYVGYTSTTPRLLPNEEDGNDNDNNDGDSQLRSASKILWDISHEITSTARPKTTQEQLRHGS